MIVNIGKAAFDDIFKADKKYIKICDALELTERTNHVADAIITLQVPNGSYLFIKHNRQSVIFGLKDDLTLWQHMYWFFWRMKKKIWRRNVR